MVTGGARIALYVHELAHTGVVANTRIAAAALAAEGHQLRIVTALPGGWVADGIEHVALLANRQRRRLFEHIAAVTALRRYLRSARPDIAVSMGNHGHAVLWAASRGKRGVQRVYRISNDLRRDIAGAPRSNCVKRWLRPRFTRALVEDCAALVLVTDALLADPILAGARADGKIAIIANGVDVDEARRRAAEPLDQPWLDGTMPTIIAVGRLATQKNFFNLLDAFALLLARQPARLIILGNSRDSMRARLLKRARQLAVERYLLMPGTTGNVFAWLARADVFAFPSWWEGFPNALLEAMAVGTPVVASRTAGPAAMVVGDTYGRLIDPAYPADIANALAQQLDTQRRILPGSRAEDFDVSRTIAGWQALARQLSNSGGERRRLSP